MLPDPDDRQLLHALMAEEGVQAWDPHSRHAPARRRGGQVPNRPVPAPSPPPPGTRTGDPVAVERDEVQRSLDRTRAELAEVRRALADRSAALDEARRALADAEAQRDALDKERRALARARPATPSPPAPQATLRAVLTDRGLAPEEHATVLAALLRAHPEAALDALERSEPLPTLLDDRLVLACEDCRPAFRPDVVVLPVPPPRCERCGGSDTRRAWQRFADACTRAGIERVVIVGGSPAYRQELRALADRRLPRLDLVDGRKRPRARRVKSQARTAHLVVAWGGTILDHATTNAYAATGVRVLQCPHRGISRMLRWLADQISTSPG